MSEYLSLSGVKLGSTLKLQYKKPDKYTVQSNLHVTCLHEFA